MADTATLDGGKVTAGAGLAKSLESRVARFSTRRYDWDALKFQADYDQKYRREQMR